MRVSNNDLIRKVDEIILEHYVIRGGVWFFDIEKISAVERDEVIGLIILTDIDYCSDSLLGDSDGKNAVFLLAQYMLSENEEKREDLLDELRKNAKNSCKNRYQKIFEERLEYLEWEANQGIMLNDWDDAA